MISRLFLFVDAFSVIVLVHWNTFISPQFQRRLDRFVDVLKSFEVIFKYIDQEEKSEHSSHLRYMSLIKVDLQIGLGILQIF